MSEPYRGFVELPKAVFDDLKKMGETIVEEAVKRAQSPATTHPRRSSMLAGVEYIYKRVFRDFEVTESRKAQWREETLVWMRHECGAFLLVTVDERVLAVRSKSDAVQYLVSLVDGSGCYCVRPDPTPHQSSLHHALMEALKKRSRVLRILMSADFALALGCELKAEGSLNGGRYLGVPILVTYGVESFDLEVD